MCVDILASLQDEAYPSLPPSLDMDGCVKMERSVLRFVGE